MARRATLMLTRHLLCLILHRLVFQSGIAQLSSVPSAIPGGSGCRNAEQSQINRDQIERLIDHDHA